MGGLEPSSPASKCEPERNGLALQEAKGTFWHEDRQTPVNTSVIAAENALWSPGPQMWCRQAGSAIDSIRINAISREVRGGRALLIKRRRWASGPLAQIANLFFRAARHPVFVWVDAGTWQRWEASSFNLLHSSQYCAFPAGSRTVCADILPGLSLAEHFAKGTFDGEMLDAAGSELRRAHRLHSPFFGGPWSHGDPNLANFLFSAHDKHARLIDFEVVHQRRLPAMARHLEDVLSFLQDLLGCAPAGTWLDSAQRFLDAYGCDEMLRGALRERLRLPSGVPKVWWWIRTNYVPLGSIRRRLERLRETLA